MELSSSVSYLKNMFVRNMANATSFVISNTKKKTLIVGRVTRLLKSILNGENRSLLSLLSRHGQVALPPNR